MPVPIVPMRKDVKPPQVGRHLMLKEKAIQQAGEPLMPREVLLIHKAILPLRQLMVTALMRKALEPLPAGLPLTQKEALWMSTQAQAHKP
jgi:hypothetical protein